MTSGYEVGCDSNGDLQCSPEVDCGGRTVACDESNDVVCRASSAHSPSEPVQCSSGGKLFFPSTRAVCGQMVRTTDGDGTRLFCLQSIQTPEKTKSLFTLRNRREENNCSWDCGSISFVDGGPTITSNCDNDDHLEFACQSNDYIWCDGNLRSRTSTIPTDSIGLFADFESDTVYCLGENNVTTGCPMGTNVGCLDQAYEARCLPTCTTEGQPTCGDINTVTCSTVELDISSDQLICDNNEVFCAPSNVQKEDICGSNLRAACTRAGSHSGFTANCVETYPCPQGFTAELF